MIKLIWPLIFIFSTSVLAKEIKTKYQLEKHIESIAKDDLMALLRDFLTESKPSRFIGKPGHTKASAFIEEKIKEFDALDSGKLSTQVFKPNTKAQKEIYEKDFELKIKGVLDNKSSDFKKWQKYTSYMASQIDEYKEVSGKNIIWSKKGEEANAKTIVLTAHYDTVVIDKETMTISKDEKMPGADYNASGVSVLLALIKTLSPLKFKYNIEVAFLDYQSLGFAGSYDYAQKLKQRDDIIGVINLEMLGNDSKFFDTKKLSGNMKMYLRSDLESGKNKDQILVDILESNSKGFAAGIRFRPLKNNFMGSDNRRFWEAGISAITLTQDWEDDFNSKRFQTSNDFPETLNQLTLYRSYVYVTGTLAMHLGVL